MGNSAVASCLRGSKSKLGQENQAEPGIKFNV